MLKLWLDDERPAPKGWTWCKSGIEFIRKLYWYEGQIDEVSLDHDLGNKCHSGYDILCFLEREIAEGHLKHVPKINIHTANPAGRKRMEQAVESIRRLTHENN